MYTPEKFAYYEYYDYVVYQELAKRERNTEFKKILESFVNQEYNDYNFWLKLSKVKEFKLSPLKIWKLILIRKIFGLTFTAKLLENREFKTVQAYQKFLETIDDENLKRSILEIVSHEREHEQRLIDQIKEDRVKFLGNIVLGLNDGLIELTGSLIGLALTLANPFIVGISGLVIGFSASFSMASSAYMQAKHEDNKDAFKSAIYTGLAYLLVSLILVIPYFLFKKVTFSMALMIISIFVVIISLSYYSSVLFNRSFLKQIFEMTIFSLGVTGLIFILTTLIKKFILGPVPLD